MHNVKPLGMNPYNLPLPVQVDLAHVMWAHRLRSLYLPTLVTFVWRYWAYRSQLFKKKKILDKTCIKVLPRSLFTPCNFYFFALTKKKIFFTWSEGGGWRNTVGNLRRDCEKWFSVFHVSWKKCIVAQGNFFEDGYASVM